MSLILPIGGDPDGALSEATATLRALKAACTGIPVEVFVIDGGLASRAVGRGDRPVDQLVQWDRSATLPFNEAFSMLETADFSVRWLPRSRIYQQIGAATAMQAAVALSRAPYLSIIPAGCPYPPELLVRLYDVAQVHEADIVTGSRFRPGAAVDGREAQWRGTLFARILRQTLRQAVRILFPEHLLHISDPLNGALLIRRSLVDGAQVWPQSHVPSLDLLLGAPWVNVVEVPYTFAQRSTRGSADEPGSIHRAWLLARQFTRLFLSVPSGAAVWKITLLWLLGTALALAPLALLLSIGQPWWGAWAVAVEAMLVVVACGNTLNMSHRARMRVALRQWLLGHWRYLIPLGLHGALTALLAQPLHSWIASFGIASLASLIALLLLDTQENPRRVLYTNAAHSLVETVHIGRVDPGGHTLTALMTAVALVVGVAAVAIEQLGFVVIIPTAILSAALILQYRVGRAHMMTVLLAVASGVAAVDYAFWRIPMTNMAAWYVAVPLLLAEMFGMAHMIGLQWSLWPRKRQRVRQEDDPTRHPVFVLIPTVNEGREVLEATVRASMATRDQYLRRYPHGRVEIVLCNDGLVANAANWEEPELLARELGVMCVTRWEAGGAKAGNIEHARQRVGAVGDALIVIFDADQVARRDFLETIVAPFSDSEIGWVQSGQYYRNVDNPVARWADDQQALFYRLLCPGKESLNAAFMCGTNLMIRAAALDEIGGLPQDSVTEDFAASILLHGRWRSVYVPEVLAVGLGPFDLAGYFRQQRRWAIGTLTVMRTQWRRVFLPALPGRGGLRFQQRLQYALGCTHYLCGVRDLIYVVVPLAYVCFGVSAVKNGSTAIYLWHFLPYWLLSLSAFGYAAWKRTGWRGVVIGFASFPVLTAAAISALLGRHARFTVTAKRRTGKGLSFVILPHLLTWIACSVALVFNWRSGVLARGPGFFVETWLAYITLMLTLTLWLAAHETIYHLAWWQALLRLYSRWRSRTIAAPVARVAQLLIGLASVSAVVSALTFTSAGLSLRNTALATFAPQQASAVPALTMLSQAPYLGIDGPTDAVTNDIPGLQQQLNVHFSIVRRSQNVTDHFDRAWADRLGAAGAYPWVSIQFGQYQADGKPSLDASLLAIANGTHDGDLVRLAQEIRAYRKPVLVTILQSVDRNWSLSSAVANGGIPADVPRAWQHVRSIFQSAGARNVAWVWAPRDPAHDEPYAPPPALIDLVLVNLTYAPAGITDDPALIHETVVKHPGKQVLVEVTTVETDAGERLWLQRLAEQMAQPIGQTSSVKGLIYFDGRPGQAPQRAPFSPDTQAVRALWRMITPTAGSALTTSRTTSRTATTRLSVSSSGRTFVGVWMERRTRSM